MKEFGLRPSSTAVSSAPRQSGQSMAFAGLFLFTLLLYVRPNEMFPDLFGTFPLIKIVAILTLLAYLGSKLASGEKITEWPIELKSLLVIALLGLLMIPVAAAPGDSTDVLTDLFMKVVIIFILMINVISTRKRLFAIWKVVVICGSFLAFRAIGAYLAGHFTVTNKGVGVRIAGAVGGIFENPNDLATSLNLLLPIAVVLGLTSTGAKRAFYFICAGLLAGGVVVTFSRGGFLGLMAMGAVLLWKMSRANRPLAILSAVLVLTVFIAAMPSGYSDRMASILHTEMDKTHSAETRRDLLGRALVIALHHPVVGVGMGNFHIYSIGEQVAHNSYLEISAELGLAGLIAFLILIFAPLKSLRRIEHATRGLVESSAGRRGSTGPPLYGEGRDRDLYYMSVAVQASLAAFIVCSFFSSIEYLWYLYYPVAFALAIRKIHESRAPVVAPEPSESAPRGVLWKQYAKGSQPPAIPR